MAKIIVTSSSHLPRFCTGVSILGAKVFPADKFSAEQLRELLADRMLTVVVGEVLELDAVDDFVAEALKKTAAKPARA